MQDRLVADQRPRDRHRLHHAISGAAGVEERPQGVLDIAIQRRVESGRRNVEQAIGLPERPVEIDSRK